MITLKKGRTQKKSEEVFIRAILIFALIGAMCPISASHADEAQETSGVEVEADTGAIPVADAEAPEEVEIETETEVETEPEFEEKTDPEENIEIPVEEELEAAAEEEELEALDEEAALGEQQIAPLAITNGYTVYKDSTPGVTESTHSTLADAVAACTTLEPFTIKVWADDLNIGSSAVIIPVNTVITLTSSTSTTRTITQQTPLVRHFSVVGTLSLENITLDGAGVGGGIEATGTVNMNNGATLCNSKVTDGSIYTSGPLGIESGASVINNEALTSGGGILLEGINNIVTIESGATISNNTAQYGGGIYLRGNDNLIVAQNGSTINGNEASVAGGAVYAGGFNNAFYTTNGSTISGNRAGDGGGIYVMPSSTSGDVTINIYDGEIINNTATGYGGGICISGLSAADPNAVLSISGGEISGNEASFGGGVCVDFLRGMSSITGGIITGNKATEGGGIYDRDWDYANPANAAKYPNLSISSAATISGNTAALSYGAPSNAADFNNSAMRGTLGVFDGSLLDNDNINYRGNFAVVYKPNNGTNGPGYKQVTGLASSGSVTLLDNATTSFTGAAATPVFKGWNTQADGLGTHYDELDSATITDSINLYAEWGPLLAVTYNANNGSGATYTDPVGYVSGQSVGIKAFSATGFTPSAGKAFDCWCTNSAGTGTRYSAGNTFAITGNTTLYALYKNQYTVTYALVDRSNRPVSGLSAPLVESNKAYGSTFGAVTAPNGARAQRVYLGWTTVAPTSSTLIKTTPITGTVTGNTTIYLVYGQDKGGNPNAPGPDGIEDSTVQETFVCSVYGDALRGPSEVYVNKGNTYNGEKKPYTGRYCSGYSIDGGATIPLGLSSAAPKIRNVQKDTKVKYLYSFRTYTIKVEHVDDRGKKISSGSYDYAQIKTYDDSWSVAAGSISGYAYKGWKLDGANKGGGAPSISSVRRNATVTLVYAKQDTGVVPKSDPPEDRNNYKFIKKPNERNVEAGEWVDYTFSGFGNTWDFEIEHYSIIDRPDAGLDFKRAQLPAFSNSSGVTYDVVFLTNKGNKIADHSNISAASPFSLEAPTLPPGEFITSIELQFGTVPAGFAVGDTMVWTFKVWDEPPAESLTNVGILSYKVGDEYKEFVSGNSGVLYIGGTFADTLAKMGDGKAIVCVGVLVLVSVCTLVYSGRRRRSACEARIDRRTEKVNS